MKKHILVLFSSIGLFVACNPASDSLIGDWKVEKVHVQFDESRSTPELVKQIGEMEQQNSISISSDSTLNFKGWEEEWHGKISLKNDTLLREGTAFGIWKNGEIVTRTNSPLGEVVVTYRKK